MTSPSRWSGELPAPTEEVPGELTWTPGYTVLRNAIRNGCHVETEPLGEVYLGSDNTVVMDVDHDELLIAPEHLEPLAAALLAAAEIVKQRKARNEQS